MSPIVSELIPSQGSTRRWEAALLRCDGLQPSGWKARREKRAPNSLDGQALRRLGQLHAGRSQVRIAESRCVLAMSGSAAPACETATSPAFRRGGKRAKGRATLSGVSLAVHRCLTWKPVIELFRQRRDVAPVTHFLTAPSAGARPVRRASRDGAEQPGSLAARGHLNVFAQQPRAGNRSSTALAARTDGIAGAVYRARAGSRRSNHPRRVLRHRDSSSSFRSMRWNAPRKVLSAIVRLRSDLRGRADA